MAKIISSVDDSAGQEISQSYAMRRPTIVITKARYWTPEPFRFAITYFCDIHYNMILLLLPSLQDILFPQDFPTNIFYLFLLSLCVLHVLPMLSVSIYSL
jgi:hypothetical protein